MAAICSSYLSILRPEAVVMGSHSMVMEETVTAVGKGASIVVITAEGRPSGGRSERGPQPSAVRQRARNMYENPGCSPRAMKRGTSSAADSSCHSISGSSSSELSSSSSEPPLPLPPSPSPPPPSPPSAAIANLFTLFCPTVASMAARWSTTAYCSSYVVMGRPPQLPSTSHDSEIEVAVLDRHTGGETMPHLTGSVHTRHSSPHSEYPAMLCARRRTAYTAAGSRPSTAAPSSVTHACPIGCGFGASTTPSAPPARAYAIASSGSTNTHGGPTVNSLSSSAFTSRARPPCMRVTSLCSTGPEESQPTFCSEAWCTAFSSSRAHAAAAPGSAGGSSSAALAAASSASVRRAPFQPRSGGAGGAAASVCSAVSSWPADSHLGPRQDSSSPNAAPRNGGSGDHGSTRRAQSQRHCSSQKSTGAPLSRCGPQRTWNSFSPTEHTSRQRGTSGGSRSRSAMSRRCMSVARMSGVAPSRFCSSLLAPARSSTSQISQRPARQACISGVSPVAGRRMSTSAPFASSSCTMLSQPKSAAPCSAEYASSGCIASTSWPHCSSRSVCA
jgi:hypothetical protein